MCCCCCPPAISALFCLWAQSGCSKGTVAGALTFFPPEPALYEFERRDRHGRVLGPDEEASDEREEAKTTPSSDDTSNGIESPNSHNNDDDDDNHTVGSIPDRVGPLEPPETRGQTSEKMKSPMEQLTEQAAERRQRSKKRHARDAHDATHDVSYRLLVDPRLQIPPHDDACIHALKIPSPRGVYVAAVLYTTPNPTSRTKTIIYSHGNATDVGAMFPMQVLLSHSLDCHVLVYDYSGYGESGGVPDECSTYRDITAVYDYVMDTIVEGDASKIVLYGQSVGSGPCCYLAAKELETTNDKPLGGMILHSPFTSGMRVLTPSRLLACLDIYPNIDRIKHVQCPVMIIHGRLDQEVDIGHGQDLHAAVPTQYKREPWWVSDRGHNDITDGPGKLAEYVRRLRRFLVGLEQE